MTILWRNYYEIYATLRAIAAITLWSDYDATITKLLRDYDATITKIKLPLGQLQPLQYDVTITQLLRNYYENYATLRAISAITNRKLQQTVKM